MESEFGCDLEMSINMELKVKHRILVIYSLVGRLPMVILSCIFLISCNSENASDCFQKSGAIVRNEVSVSDFTKITVFENVNLVLKQGDETKVEIETGEFLKNEVVVTVEDDQLLLRDTNDCNYVRAYGMTTIYVTAPNITEIRSSTGGFVHSEGVLTYANMKLLSESFINTESETTDGEFDLQLDTQNLSVVVNGIAYFKLRGMTEILDLTIAAGDSRIETKELISQSVNLNHRGSNDMFINPQQSIKGVIRGTGDVISYKRPEEVEVEELFNGRLLFRD